MKKVKTTKKVAKAGKIKFAERIYTPEYLKLVPPAYAKKNKTVWKEAVDEYLRREHFSFTKLDFKKPLATVDFGKLTRIYNTLIGRRNRPAKSVKVA